MENKCNINCQIDIIDNGTELLSFGFDGGCDIATRLGECSFGGDKIKDCTATKLLEFKF